MANVVVTDQTQVSASVDVSDSAPLSLASLKALKFSSLPIVSDFGKPLDRFPLDRVDVGLDLGAAGTVIGSGVLLGLSGGVNAGFTIKNSGQVTLFEADEFAPMLTIGTGECWGGLTVDVTLNETVGASSPAGFGVFAKAGTSVALSTYVRFPEVGTGMPSFADGLKRILESYSFATKPEQLRAIPVGVAHVSEASGSVSLGAFYAFPIEVNPLASVGMPFNLSQVVSPRAGAALSAEVTLEGCFVLRVYRSGKDKLVVGLYKKRETSLSAVLTAAAGMGVSFGNQGNGGAPDVLSKVLDAVLPGANVDQMSLDDETRQELNDGLKHCADHSLSIALNVCCTATDSDEAAVIYELDFGSGDPVATDKAVAAALKGDWSRLAELSNARELRHVLREAKDRNHKLRVNLLGFYNAGSIADYLRTTTVLRDENGQVTIVDKDSAKTLTTGSAPYAAKAEKLRFVLAQAFVATVTYGACASKAGLSSFNVTQSILKYRAQASKADFNSELALAKVFGFAMDSDLEGIVRSNMPLTHNQMYVSANYDYEAVCRLFYQDVEQRKPYAASVIDGIGRDTKIKLLDPTGATSPQRRMALSDDAIWAAMNACGNVAIFKQLPGLARFSTAAIQAISADWIDIRWWSDAMQELPAHLTAVLNASAKSTTSNPSEDAALVSAHRALSEALSRVMGKTHSAFNDGWPVAVMYCLANQAAKAESGIQVEIDISVNGKVQNQKAGQPIAMGQATAN